MSELDFLRSKSVSPQWEMAAYEALWNHKKATFKTIADCFRDNPEKVPSELVTDEEIRTALTEVLKQTDAANIHDYGILVHGSIEYPEQLRDAANPIELLYYRGWWDLIHSPKRIAIVGAREVSEGGATRTKRLVRLLVNDGFTIVSGLAKGVDAIAHRRAIEFKGRTIAVIGTPITEYYPPENRELQEEIARDHLLVSQVPISRYSQQDYRINRLFFPERNVTMSAIAHATVIVEASDKSGSLSQARAALQQGRKLFILDSNFQDPTLTWPAKFEAQGAIRVKGDDIADIQAAFA